MANADSHFQQRLCPMNQYGQICEKLIHLLEAQMEWLVPAGDLRPYIINPHPYHFSGKVEPIPSFDSLKDNEEVPDKMKDNEEVPENTKDNEEVHMESKWKEPIRMKSSVSAFWDLDPW